MQSRRMGALVAVLAVAVAVVLFVVLRNDDGDADSTVAETTTTEATTPEPGGDGGASGEEPKPEVATIVVKDGQPVGGVAELEFTKGEAIRFVVESDVDEEVHLHGYDIGKEVSAGGTVEFDVPATIDGVFEVELEESVVPLAEITVNPA